MENFTIHIFGFGETQINSNEFSHKLKTIELTKAKPLVDAICNKKPLDLETKVKPLFNSILAKKPLNLKTKEIYHVIHIFGYNEIRFVSEDGFGLQNQEDLKPFIDDLILEIENHFKETIEPIVE
jgi:hypothetical protein